MYKYYQPNKKDLKDKYGDCTIRALSKALNYTWLEAYDIVQPFEREQQCPFPCLTLDLYKEFYKRIGFKYNSIKVPKGSKRPTVKSFAKKNKKGTYICRVANHFVTIVDGNWYDTWDCGHCSLYGYYTKESD